MPKRSFRLNRILHAALGAALTLSSAFPLPAQAGGVTGQATEWTQLANNTELISLVGKSAEQVNNQITQISQLAEQIQLNPWKPLFRNGRDHSQKHSPRRSADFNLSSSGRI